jgi:hypothetical protein
MKFLLGLGRLWRRSLLRFLGDLLGEENLMNVWQHSTASDGHFAQKFPQFVVVSDRQLNVAGDDSGLLVVTGSISGQFQHLGGQIFQDSSNVDGRAASNPLGIPPLLEISGDPPHRKLQPGLHCSAHRLLPGACSLPPSLSAALS